jgi:urease subunit gamma/beta
MKLSQTEIDRVLIFNVAQMSRARQARGLRLNYPEAVALITDEMMERARDGWDYEAVRAHGMQVLTEDDVLPGVPDLVRGLVCEPMFEDGPRIIVLPRPIESSSDAPSPGERRFASNVITINAGREPISISVTNGSDRVVNISSHYHFYEINPRMIFDRPPTYGRHLDIQAGRSVIWEPGETKQVELVEFSGDRIIDGFQLQSAVDDHAPEHHGRMI